MTTENGRAFNEWLRAQLKAKKMSQRQLAQQSGVDHSTISRLIRGDRMPSLGTATKLARGLREIREDSDTAHRARRGVRGAAEPDGPRRVRAPRGRGAHGAAGPPDHGVLPGRPGPPVRADVLERRCRRNRASTATAPTRPPSTAQRPHRRAAAPRPAPPPRYGAQPPLRGRRPARRVATASPGHDPRPSVRVSGTANAGLQGRRRISASSAHGPALVPPRVRASADSDTPGLRGVPALRTVQCPERLKRALSGVRVGVGLPR